MKTLSTREIVQLQPQRTRGGKLTACLTASLLSGCATVAPSGNDAVCDALRPHLPTVAAQDTRDTMIGVLTFHEAFAAACR